MVDYLVEAETGPMGLSKADAQKAKEVAEICADWNLGSKNTGSSVTALNKSLKFVPAFGLHRTR